MCTWGQLETSLDINESKREEEEEEEEETRWRKKKKKKERVDEDDEKKENDRAPQNSSLSPTSPPKNFAIPPSFCLTSHITTSKVFPSASFCEANSHEEAVVTVRVC